MKTKAKCPQSLLARKHTSIFVWHSTEKCVLGFTPLMGSIVVFSAKREGVISSINVFQWACKRLHNKNTDKFVTLLTIY